MSRFTLVGVLVLALAGLASWPAAGEVFFVTLKNGSVLETHTQPQEASWDGSMVLLMTDVGNWIGVSKAEIEGVRSDVETEGYGIRINNSTIALGWSPNDAAIEEEQQLSQQDRTSLLFLNAMGAMVGQQSQQQSYTQKQFVEPDQLQGIPSGFVGGGTNTLVVPPP
jgi:hypothetical protein